MQSATVATTTTVATISDPLESHMSLAETIENGQLTEAQANYLREHLQDTGLGYGPHTLNKWIDVLDAIATELGE